MTNCNILEELGECIKNFKPSCRFSQKQLMTYFLGEKLEEEIRKLMFVFEDIVTLDNLAIQRFIRETDSKDLAVALKSTSDEVKQTIFSNMSQRMRENIEGDMQYLHNIRLSDVEEAQQKIVGIIRQLQESGDIIISKGGKDEIIA